MTHSTLSVIERLEAMPKQGVSYDEKGRHGWRNPIRQDTGMFLELFGRKAKRILEIGTAHGLSACYLGSGGAEVVTIEWDELTAEQAQINLNEAGINAKVLCGDVLKIIKTLALLKPFDLVFFDANKDGYLEQLQLLQRNNLLTNWCWVLADNVIDRQTECQNFLDYMQNKKHVIIPTECGLLVGVV